MYKFFYVFLLSNLLLGGIQGRASEAEINKVLAIQQASLASMNKKIEDCAKKSDIPKIPDPAWPSGSYCIFKNGACPAGFTAASMKLDAVQMWGGAKDVDYYVGGAVGESYAAWENRPINNALMRIYACCK